MRSRRDDMIRGGMRKIGKRTKQSNDDAENEEWRMVEVKRTNDDWWLRGKREDEEYKMK